MFQSRGCMSQEGRSGNQVRGTIGRYPRIFSEFIGRRTPNYQIFRAWKSQSKTRNPHEIIRSFGDGIGLDNP